eukprot:GHVS01078841.1.p1 GENE.GHVS01078841.1~~GHVS01078841.1.p1  ORF type:complete len:130 (+),score=19.96 GHVS01078841.1:472-861(+)
MVAVWCQSSLLLYNNFAMRLILLFWAFSVFSDLSSEAASHSGGLSIILQTGAEENVQSPSAPTTISPRFAAYPICDLAAPHLMLGLPSLSSTHHTLWLLSTQPSIVSSVSVLLYLLVCAEHQLCIFDFV